MQCCFDEIDQALFGTNAADQNRGATEDIESPTPMLIAFNLLHALTKSRIEVETRMGSRRAVSACTRSSQDSLIVSRKQHALSIDDLDEFKMYE